MTTLEVHPDPTPSQELIKDANAEVLVQDAGGRSIKLKNPGVAAQYRIVRALGPDASSNSTFMSMVAPLLYVRQIGDEPVFFPTNEEEVYVLVDQLGEKGLAAVMEGVTTHYVVDPEADKANAKK